MRAYQSAHNACPAGAHLTRPLPFCLTSTVPVNSYTTSMGRSIWWRAADASKHVLRRRRWMRAQVDDNTVLLQQQRLTSHLAAAASHQNAAPQTPEGS
jgi:hypothetical protein